ncbi:MAG TPA: thiol-disulfide isomerase, partial [Isosphaeraceae bacterium]|nr:thiol-disulfide isomerase [Isosphaeraceae bacterium]
HDMPRGMTLFAFGDRDGKAGQAQFQHCLGLTYADGKVYVADTYNNKIKTLDPRTRTVTTLAGSRQAGSTDKPPQFDEPGGVSAAGTNVFVADTNNQAIRIVSLTSGEVTTLALSGVEPPRPPATKPKFPNAKQLAVEPATVAPGETFALDVTLKLPEGFKINPEAPMPILLETPDDPSALGPDLPPTGLRLNPPRDRFAVDVPLSKEAKAGDKLSLKLSVSAFECKEGAAGLCRIKNYVWTIPVEFASNGKKTVSLTNAEKEE